MPRIRASDVDEVKSRTNLYELIGERVALKSAGVGSYKGLCPFHDEKSPSFHVRPEAGFYHCFGCSASGDAISFVRELDHLSFTEAVERLAARIGFALTYEEGGATVNEGPVRTRLYAANTAAAAFFRDQLVSAEAETGRRFLGERGFDAGAAAHFGIGYAPKGWDNLTKHLLAKGFTMDELTAAGLVSARDRGGAYDRFRGRLVWPIRDITGQTIGFGARKLYDDDQGPKYLNTPETPIYKKNQVLYGLDLAKRAISRAEPRQVVIVEGYTDVMACHLAGVESAVATCGTAFGSEHTNVLRRVMGDDSAQGEVIFTFDPDAAGQKAALRAFAEDKRFNAQTYVATGIDGLDPCDLRLQRGDAAVRAMVDHKVPMFEFVIDQKLKGFDLASVEGRIGALRQAAPVVAELRDPLVRAQYERVLARRLGMDQAEVSREVKRLARYSSRVSDARPLEPAATPEHADSPGSAPSAAPWTLQRVVQQAQARGQADALRLEREALAGVLQFGHLLDAPSIDVGLAGDFVIPAFEAVRQAVVAAPDRGAPGWAGRAAEQVREPYRQVAAELLMAPFPARDDKQALMVAGDLLRNVRKRTLKLEKDQLLGAIQRIAPDSDEGRALRERLRAIDQELRNTSS